MRAVCCPHPFLPYFICQPFVQQAFVEEMVDEGKVGWLQEFSSSSDKVALIAKVSFRLCYHRYPHLHPTTVCVAHFRVSKYFRILFVSRRVDGMLLLKMMVENGLAKKVEETKIAMCFDRPKRYRKRRSRIEFEFPRYSCQGGISATSANTAGLVIPLCCLPARDGHQNYRPKADRLVEYLYDVRMNGGADNIIIMSARDHTTTR